MYFPSEYRVINYTLEEASKDEVAPDIVLSALENYEKVYASEAEQKYTLIYPRKIGYKFNYKCTGSGATIEDKKTLVVKPLTNAEYGDINIELEWGEEAIRIHFDANGGRLWENGLEEQTVPWMVNVHKLEEYYTPVKANAKFLGWKCDGKMVTDVKDIAPNDEDLYNFTAVWDDDEDGPAEVVFDQTGYLGVDGDYESVKWGYNEEKKLLVISGKGATRDFAGGATSRDYNPWIAPKLDIEKVVVENGITAIGAYTFMECDTIKSIELPSTVKKIGKSAFNSCGKLASINIPSGVTKILDATFAGCSQLKTLELPKKLTVIEGFAFSGCSSLTKITIPDTVTSIGNQAFEDCNSLTSITIPKNVKSVGEQAFFSCKKLKTVKLLCKAPTLTSTFENCTALTSVTVPATAKVLNHTFLGCKNLTKVTLKSGVQKLNGTFGNCTKLKSLTIPSSVTTLNSPVYGCKNLKTITIKSKKLTSKTINKGVWKNLNKKLVIKVPKDKLKAYKALFKKKGFKGSIKAI